MDINEFVVAKYAEFINKARALKASKMKDYNSGRINRFSYALHGNQTFVDELYKKVLRLVSITDSGQGPDNESLEDTLVDIMNYAADFYAYLEWKKTEEGKTDAIH